MNAPYDRSASWRGSGAPSLKPVSTLLTTQWFTVYDRGGYLTVETSTPHVIVLPLVGEDSVVMVRVKRPVIADMPLELPAGAASPGESPAQAAARELGEETGISVAVERMRELPPLSNDPNRNPSLLRIFQADLSPKEYASRQAFDHEIAEVVLLGLREAASMIARGEIYVSVPAAVIGRHLLGLGAIRT